MAAPHPSWAQQAWLCPGSLTCDGLSICPPVPASPWGLTAKLQGPVALSARSRAASGCTCQHHLASGGINWQGLRKAVQASSGGSPTRAAWPGQLLPCRLAAPVGWLYCLPACVGGCSSRVQGTQKANAGPSCPGCVQTLTKQPAGRGAPDPQPDLLALLAILSSPGKVPCAHTHRHPPRDPEATLTCVCFCKHVGGL